MTKLAGSQVSDRCPLGYLLLYVRWKSGVTFARGCFRDEYPRDLQVSAKTLYLVRPRLCIIVLLFMIYLFYLDPLTGKGFTM